MSSLMSRRFWQQYVDEIAVATLIYELFAAHRSILYIADDWLDARRIPQHVFELCEREDGEFVLTQYNAEEIVVVRRKDLSSRRPSSVRLRWLSMTAADPIKRARGIGADAIVFKHRTAIAELMRTECWMEILTPLMQHGNTKMYDIDGECDAARVYEETRLRQ